MKIKYRYTDDDGIKRQVRFATKAELNRFKTVRAEARKERQKNEDTDSDGVTFAQWTQEWLTVYAQAERTPKQATAAKRIIDQRLIPAFGKVKLKDLRETHLAVLRLQLKEHPVGRYKRMLAPKTANHILQLAKQIVGVAVRRRLIDWHPWQGVKLLPSDERAMLYWTADQREQFLRFCRPVDPGFARVVTLACHTGLRLSELRALRRSQLDFRTKMIQVSAVEDEAGNQELRTKNRSLGYVPINASAFAILKDLQLAHPDARDLLITNASDILTAPRALTADEGAPRARIESRIPHIVN